MSADNGYLVQQDADGRWVAQHYFLSADDRPNPNEPGQVTFSSLESCIAFYRDAAQETEYGFEILYSGDPIFRKATPEEVQHIRNPRPTLMQNAFDMQSPQDAADSAKLDLDHTEDTLHRVYEAMHENGISGAKAIDLINSIHNKGVLFRDRL